MHMSFDLSFNLKHDGEKGSVLLEDRPVMCRCSCVVGIAAVRAASIVV